MSLRLRLLLLLVFNNALVFVAIQFATFQWHSAELRAQRDGANELVQKVLGQSALQLFRVGYDQNTAPKLVESVLPLDAALRTLVEDIQLVVIEDETIVLRVNPIGASLRSREQNLAIERTGDEFLGRREAFVAAGGNWTPVIIDDRLAGGVWFSFRLPEPAAPSLWNFSTPVLLLTFGCALLMDLLLYFGVVVPLRGLGRSARQIGEGVIDVEMPQVRAPELRVFVRAFEAMAARVRGHRQELEREIRLAVEEVHRHERALQQSGRLASMGTLAAGIAHEINNPIGGMLNALRLIEKRDDLDERERRYLGLIRSGLERIARTARRVLDMSPKGTEAVAFSIRGVVESALALAEHRIKEQAVDVRLDFEPDLPQPTGDPQEFEQVVLNLLLNALDVMIDQPEQQLRISANRADLGSGSVVRLEVSDNGPGVEKDVLPQITDPFFSAKGRPDASGLGLFI
ncbi:MAG: ATP-binding protein, partial [Planctomycetota bacterium]